MPQLPSLTLENGVRCRKRLQLELRWRGKREARKALVSLGFLLRVIFPLDITFPTRSLILNVEIRILRDISTLEFFVVTWIESMRLCVDLDTALVTDAETCGLEALF
jgi:hypothetical protein